MKKLGLGLLAVLVTSPAYAHIRVENYTSRDGDAQKDGPCGAVGSQWGAKGSTTFEPGATVEIKINEYVSHPGYFRIAFDADGDDGFESPKSIQSIDPNRRSASMRDMNQGSDFCNNDTVLLDNLEAHKSGGGQRSFQVKLPDVECERCTLQIVQVMEDVIHGPYNLEVSASEFDLPDLYYQCIDVQLKRAAGAAAPSGNKPACTVGPLLGGQANSLPKSDAGVAQGDGGSQGGGEGASTSSPANDDDGCSLASRGASGAWLLALALFLMRRRTNGLAA